MLGGQRALKAENVFMVFLEILNGPCVLPQKEQDRPVFWLAQGSEANPEDRWAGDYFVTKL